MKRKCFGFQAKYSSQPTGMTVVFPPSGIRVYATTEALLRAQLETQTIPTG